MPAPGSVELTLHPGVCQVAHIGVSELTCPVMEANGYRCEIAGPHGDTHRISEHTINHALMGSGYRCDSIVSDTR